MKRANIRSVAKAAGVSIATVSRTFSNPSLVSDDARHRVEDAARKLEFAFQPRSRPARVIGYAKRVGFIVPDQQHQIDETITEQFWKGAHFALAAQHIELVMDYVDLSGDVAANPPRVFSDPSVQGFLLRAIPNRDSMQKLCRSRKVVVLGNSYPDLDVSYAGSDDYAGMKIMLDYLFELGHRRIAFVSPPTCGLIYLRRFQAYRLFLEDRGLPVDARLIKVVASPDSWWVDPEETVRYTGQFMQELLDLHPRPTAIACATDTFAAGLIAATQERGIKVPEELSITGFGNRLHSVVLHPPLTTVHVDQRAIGMWGATLLLRALAGETPPVQALVRPRLVERRSCRRLKADL